MTAPERTLEQLAADYQAGNAEALDEIVKQCLPIVRNVCRGFFLIGADSEDLFQEGLLGILGAARKYDSAKGSFKNFAGSCVKNSVISAVRRYSGKRNEMPSETLWQIGSEGIGKEGEDPEEIFIEGEVLEELIGAIDGELSAGDREILGLYLDGLTYAEIAERTHKSQKAVDNALQKIKNKLRRLLAEKRG